MPFELACSAFKEGELIPKKHTCEGEDLSPPLRWNHPPGAREVLRSLPTIPMRRVVHGCIGYSTTSRWISVAWPKGFRLRRHCRTGRSRA